MSFQTDIEAYTGSITAEASEATKYLKDAVKYITKILMMDDLIASKLSATQRLSTTNGVTLTLTDELKILYVTRFSGEGAAGTHKDKVATQTLPERAPLLADVNSIYATNEEDPKYYIEDNVLTVFPEPTNASPADVRTITPALSVALNATTITGLPIEYHDGVIFHVARNILLQRITDADEDAELTNWYQQQYALVDRLLKEFLEPYIVGRMSTGGIQDEAPTNA